MDKKDAPPTETEIVETKLDDGLVIKEEHTKDELHSEGTETGFLS